MEVDLESSPSRSSSSDGEVEVLKMRKLEEAIHALFVEKSTPDWLPFIPGSSFWVPPRKRPVDVVHLVEKLWNPSREEEVLNFATSRGWPSLEFFSAKGSNFDANLTEKKMILLLLGDRIRRILNVLLIDTGKIRTT